MSAIWGAIALEDRPLAPGIASRMQEDYEDCVIDKFRFYEDSNVSIGCGIQFFTPEAHGEVLPIIDSESQVFFAGDILLDNRQELIERLQLPGDPASIPDGTVLYEMLRAYGEDCLNDLLGAYAFVYYEKARRRVSLVLDATGCRILYYRVKDGVLYFSTLVKPLLSVCGNEGVNERWITDFLALDHLGMVSESEESAYAQILHLAPRQIVTFQNGAMQKRTYWNPEIKELRLENDAAYAARLKEVFRGAVQRFLRVDRTALLLSGGLDSTAVACYAARELAKEGRTLHSYTSVPEPDFSKEMPAFYVLDESENVLKTKAFLEERGTPLSCTFLDLAGINGWDGHHTEMAGLEIPYKSLQNLLWIAEALRTACADGSRVLLHGGFGNVTISAVGRDIYYCDLLRKGHFITFARQCTRFSRARGLSRKKNLAVMWKLFWDYFLPGRPDTSDEKLFGQSLVSREMIEKYDLRRRFAAEAKAHFQKTRRFDLYQTYLFNDEGFTLSGEIGTKHSLMTGAILRDVTMDKRLIEFCLSLPADQFARDGVTRRLVRQYMRDDLPPHVLRVGQYGMQSADLVERVAKQWPRIYRELLQIYRDNRTSPYVDCERAIAMLEQWQNSTEGMGPPDLFRLCFTAMALEFIAKTGAPR